jgi:4-amino-4-deoxy-L-arabinose transferase-like glycosyltransferase
MTTSDYPARGLEAFRDWPIRMRLRLRSVSAEGWIVAGLLLAAAVIRFVVIDNQSFWADEALTAYEARLGFGPMLSVVMHIETTPPLYFVLIWFWGHLFGTGGVALRSLSTIAGIALVPVAYLAARELASRRAGVLAAAFVAFNPFLIWYSQEARTYMLLTLLSGLSFLYFARARRDPSTRNATWWAVWSALALTTHFFAAFLVAAEALWLLRLMRTPAVVRAVIAVAVVELAMLPFAFADTSHGTGWIAAIPKQNRISNAISEWGASILYRRASIPLGLLAGIVVAAIVAGVAMWGGDRRTQDAVKVGAAIGGCVWIAPLVLAFVGQDYFLSRNVMPAVIPFAVTLGAAGAAPSARLVGGALAAALLALFAYAAIQVQTHPYLERPNWRAVARALGPATVPRAVFAADGTTANPLKIYLPGAAWSEPPGRRLVIDQIDVVGATKRLHVLATAPKTIVPARHVQLPAGGETLPNVLGRPVPAKLTPAGTVTLARLRVGNWVLARFELAHPITATIDEVVKLVPRFFHRAPVSVLVFYQPSGR